MKHVATTLTEMSGQIANEDLAGVCGGFNPQPDPPRLGSTFGLQPPSMETDLRSESGILAGNVGRAIAPRGPIPTSGSPVSPGSLFSHSGARLVR